MGVKHTAHETSCGLDHPLCRPDLVHGADCHRPWSPCSSVNPATLVLAPIHRKLRPLASHSLPYALPKSGLFIILETKISRRRQGGAEWHTETVALTAKGINDTATTTCRSSSLWEALRSRSPIWHPGIKHFKRKRDPELCCQKGLYDKMSIP